MSTESTAPVKVTSTMGISVDDSWLATATPWDMWCGLTEAFDRTYGPQGRRDMIVDKLTLEIYHRDMNPGRVRQVVVDALREEFGDPDATVDLREVTGRTPTNDDIDHGVHVRVLPGPLRRAPNLGRNHGVGRITWYSKNVDPAKTEFGVAMDDGIGTSQAGLADVELIDSDSTKVTGEYGCHVSAGRTTTDRTDQ